MNKVSTLVFYLCHVYLGPHPRPVMRFQRLCIPFSSKEGCLLLCSRRTRCALSANTCRRKTTTSAIARVKPLRNFLMRSAFSLLPCAKARVSFLAADIISSLRICPCWLATTMRSFVISCRAANSRPSTSQATLPSLRVPGVVAGLEGPAPLSREPIFFFVWGLGGGRSGNRRGGACFATLVKELSPW